MTNKQFLKTWKNLERKAMQLFPKNDQVGFQHSISRGFFLPLKSRHLPLPLPIERTSNIQIFGIQGFSCRSGLSAGWSTRLTLFFSSFVLFWSNKERLLGLSTIRRLRPFPPASIRGLFDIGFEFDVGLSRYRPFIHVGL